ncbi:heparin-binding EGF-like growth factor a [Lepisosteus oculatus]|uniref:heparin-binding EGF-like growth factor a n=1 Tax=Lepisosteus oculatus TaxID=7918 RepID=UPI0035F52DC7
MKVLAATILGLFCVVLSSSVRGATIARYDGERTAEPESLDRGDPLGGGKDGEGDLGDYRSSEAEEYDEEYESGDGEVGFPRVAFSTKPRDPPARSSPEPGQARKGKGKRKGQGRKRNPCLKKYKDFCIHGVCQYIRDLKAPSCICQPGYTGERCHFFSLPVVTGGESYSRSTALAVVAVVLSSLCLLVIGMLLAFRYHKRGAYDVENEEKVKLGTATSH